VALNPRVTIFFHNTHYNIVHIRVYQIAVQYLKSWHCYVTGLTRPTCATCGIGPAYSPDVPEWAPGFRGGCAKALFFGWWCVDLWLYFVFFLLWSLFCILSEIYGFWLFLLWRLITPLVSYDSPFDTFWLLLWYFLITLWYLLLTHLVHCAYLFGTFWLPLWYLLPTLLVSSDHPLIPTAYPFGTFSLPLYFLRDTPFFILPTLLLPSRWYFGTFWLSFSLVPSAYPLLSSDYLFDTFCLLIVIFWLPLWYLLITTFGTFWLLPLLPSCGFFSTSWFFGTFCLPL
jgi:hypothetical protein